MKYRTLGRTGLEVSLVRLGTGGPSRIGVSMDYEISATPFAFVIDDQGRIAESGIISQRRSGFVPGVPQRRPDRAISVVPAT